MAIYSVLSPEAENEGYGIKVVSERFIYDISRNYTAVSELCSRCNNLNLDPVHFDIVLEDFLSRKSSF